MICGPTIVVGFVDFHKGNLLMLEALRGEDVVQSTKYMLPSGQVYVYVKLIMPRKMQVPTNSPINQT
ncbi:hypothetical protein [Lysinibacillus telephonicus]|uniref:hypothetical protein n=1 Tax=Lysinibacillus telephonicus TaxID=1714840 RepID=UPI003BA11362